jgi:hypothetical protein
MIPEGSRVPPPKSRPTEIMATRTLVKSVPELWELLDGELRLRYWSSHLCEGEGQVEVIACRPGRMVAWRCEGPTPMTVEVTLAEKGFGTQVGISAQAEEVEEVALERLLEELAEPQRRPFT